MDKATFTEFLAQTKQLIADDKQRIADAEKDVAADSSDDGISEETDTVLTIHTPEPEPIATSEPATYKVFGGGGSAGRPVKEIDLENIKDFLNVVNAVELPKIHDLGRRETFEAYRAAVKAAEVELLEKLG